MINETGVRPIKQLLTKTHWMFDMDGTLTHAIHDFEAIKASLGLETGKPILESIADLPDNEAQAVHKKLDDIEYEIADKATAHPHADELLSLLQKNNCKIGIVTRNGHGIAKATLKACGLHSYFNNESIISRHCATPKPAPDGVELLLSRWSTNASSAVIIGDYLYDLEAGKSAGISTVHLDTTGKFAWPDYTDHGIESLAPLAQLWQQQ